MIITFDTSSIGELTLQAGQQVDFSTAIAKTVNSEGFRLEIAEELGIPNDKIFMHLSKIVGDTVEANEVLAIKKSSFSTKRIIAPHDGTIKEIDHETGTLVIEGLTGSTHAQKSYFTGTVKEVKGAKVSLEVSSSEKYELKDVTADFGGEILYSAEERLPALTEDDLPNKVVFTEKIKPAEAVRLDVLGIQGLITKSDIKEKEGVNSAEITDKEKWPELIKTKFQYCIIDKKNATMYLYDIK